jgi:NADPH:quinone reductase-like Zn-dependent oxidoreductase
VLVRVEATSVNPIDWKRGSGKLKLVMPAFLPLVPGYDVAGTVVEAGGRATEFPVGTRVHARISDSRGGASAEFALVSLDVLTRIPEGMSSADAAALPLAGMTALQGLRDTLGLPLKGARQRVMVVGASGGVGHFAVQIAASTGATVIGVCSTRNVELVRGLGAKEVIDYSKSDAFAGLAPVDLVLDCVDGNAAPYLPHIAAGGRYASPVITPGLLAKQVLNPLARVKELMVMLKPNAADLGVLDRLWKHGQLKVVIDSTFPLEKLGEAWAKSISGRSVGKLVVEVAKAP